MSQSCRSLAALCPPPPELLPRPNDVGSSPFAATSESVVDASGQGRPRPVRLAGVAGAWVLGDPRPGGVIGQEVSLPSSAIDFGGRPSSPSMGRSAAAGVNIEARVRGRTGRLMGADVRVTAQPSPEQPPMLSEAFPRVKLVPTSFKELRGHATLQRASPPCWTAPPAMGSWRTTTVGLSSRRSTWRIGRGTIAGF